MCITMWANDDWGKDGRHDVVMRITLGTKDNAHSTWVYTQKKGMDIGYTTHVTHEEAQKLMHDYKMYQWDCAPIEKIRSSEKDSSEEDMPKCTK